MARKDSGKQDSGQVAVERQQPIHAVRDLSRKEGFVSIYANDVQVQTSPWDLRLILGEIGDESADPIPTLRINKIGEVRMSPQFAKKVAQMMVEQLAAYERMFGKIPDVPDQPPT